MRNQTKIVTKLLGDEEKKKKKKKKKKRIQK